MDIEEITTPHARSSQPIAGPPHIPSSSRSAPAPAPERPLPSTHFYSVEYPGYVRPISAPLVIDRLGGQDAIDSAFRRATGRDRVESLLELRLRPDNPYAHPIPGEIVPTSNIVLKVVKRKRKRRDGDPAYADGPIGEYTVEAVGVVPKTARFRSECVYLSAKARCILAEMV